MLQGAGRLGQLHRNVFIWQCNVCQVDGDLTEMYIQILKPIGWDDGYFFCHVRMSVSSGVGTSSCEDKLLGVAFWIAGIVGMVGVSGTAETGG